jgi:hypothetical protein
MKSLTIKQKKALCFEIARDVAVYASGSPVFLGVDSVGIEGMAFKAHALYNDMMTISFPRFKDEKCFRRFLKGFRDIITFCFKDCSKHMSYKLPVPGSLKSIQQVLAA